MKAKKSGSEKKKPNKYEQFQAKVLEKLNEAEGKVQRMDIRKLCKTTLKMRFAVPNWGEQVRNGMLTDLQKEVEAKPDITVDELIQPYRDEPLFQKVMDKVLKWNDDDLIECAKKAGAK